jgi:hypothetical protein
MCVERYNTLVHVLVMLITDIWDSRSGAALIIESHGIFPVGKRPNIY